MNKPQKTYSALQLISVAAVANTLAQSRSIAGLEALQQLAEAVEGGSLCADLYQPHAPCFNGGNSDLIGKPTSNSLSMWRRIATKSSERYKGDVDDFSYPPAASTWHLMADDVFEFANNSALNARAAAAMRELAIRYKPELDDLQGDAAEPMTTRQKLQPCAAPTLNTATPASVVAASDGPAKRSNRKPSWATVAMPYMKSLFTAGRYKSASMFYKALMLRTGESDSPFKLVNRELFCTEAGTAVSAGSLGNVWPQIRAH